MHLGGKTSLEITTVVKQWACIQGTESFSKFRNCNEPRVMITDELWDGVIKSSYSEWASPLVLDKRTCALILLVHCPKMNDVTYKDNVPLPGLDGTLEAVGSDEFSIAHNLAFRHFAGRIDHFYPEGCIWASNNALQINKCQRDFPMDAPNQWLT